MHHYSLSVNIRIAFSSARMHVFDVHGSRAEQDIRKTPVDKR